MTDLEKSSKRKAKAIRYLVDKGEYSAGYGLREVERLHDEGKMLDVDYEPLAEYLEELMDREEQEAIEQVEEVIKEPIEDDSDITKEVSGESEGEVE